MWVVTRHGFYSAVQHRDDPGRLLVRARARSDLDAMLAVLGRDSEVVNDTCADYRYRVTIEREAWATFLAAEAAGVDYESHAKEAMAGSDRRRYDAYLDCWAALARLQH